MTRDPPLQHEHLAVSQHACIFLGSRCPQQDRAARYTRGRQAATRLAAGGGAPTGSGCCTHHIPRPAPSRSGDRAWRSGEARSPTRAGGRASPLGLNSSTVPFGCNPCPVSLSGRQKAGDRCCRADDGRTDRSVAASQQVERAQALDWHITHMKKPEGSPSPDKNVESSLPAPAWRHQAASPCAAACWHTMSLNCLQRVSPALQALGARIIYIRMEASS